MGSLHRRRAVALLAAALVLAGALPAAAAGRDPRPARGGECNTLTKQIAHFEGISDLALDRGDGLWFQATRAHIERLENQRIRRCPGYERPNPMRRFIRSTGLLLKRAGKWARRIFTSGALG